MIVIFQPVTLVVRDKGLKPSFSVNPSHGFPGLLTDTSENNFLFIFPVFPFLVVGSVRSIKLSRVGF